MLKRKKLDLKRISENITHLMEKCGIDATELSKQTDLPASTISRLRSAHAETTPNLSSLLPIADFFRVTLSQLIGEEPLDKLGVFKPSKVSRTCVPVLSAEAIADFLLGNQKNNSPLIDVDVPLSSKAFAYVLKGNAMEPQFPENTLLIIDPQATLENLDHVLVIPQGKKTPIFRQVMMDGDEKFLRTLNPMFNEFIRFTEECYQILGVMIQSRRNFKGQSNSSLKDAFYA